MTSSLPSPETGNQVGDVDTPCPQALFKEVGPNIGGRMRVCGLGDTVSTRRVGEAGGTISDLLEESVKKKAPFERI